jgi:septal ring factor EnvC (AmiA/AmiB activator)
VRAAGASRGTCAGRRRRAAIAGLLVGLLAAAAPALADRGEELARLRQAISESRDRVAVYEREHRNLFEAVEALDRAAAALSGEVAGARERVRRARAILEQVTVEAESIRRRLHLTERAMSQRAVSLYKAGERAGVRMLFAAGGIREFLARISALRLLLARDVDLLARHRSESALLTASRERADAATRASEIEAAELRAREAELANERASKHRLVARLQGDRARERSALVELEHAARALEETLRTLRDEPRSTLTAPAGPGFAALRHSLPPPVDAPIARGFGRVVDAEFFTETVRNGVEYDAPYGEPVRAVAPGSVRFAGWFRGFGRLVILDHGDDTFTVSGHLAELAVGVGDQVATGDRIGSVGDTGSLSGPQLYFEIRRSGQPVDPSEWLRQGDSG